MDELDFYKYKDSWVLTSFEKVEEGFYLAAPPVRIVPFEDADQLKTVLLDLLEEETPLVARPDFDAPRELGIRTKALKLKSDAAFFKHGRCFYLRRVKDTISVEEWMKEKRSWVANPPLWEAEFRADQIDELIDYLVERTKSEG